MFIVKYWLSVSILAYRGFRTNFNLNLHMHIMQVIFEIKRLSYFSLIFTIVLTFCSYSDSRNRIIVLKKKIKNLTGLKWCLKLQAYPEKVIKTNKNYF